MLILVLDKKNTEISQNQFVLEMDTSTYTALLVHRCKLNPTYFFFEGTHRVS